VKTRIESFNEHSLTPEGKCEAEIRAGTDKVILRRGNDVIVVKLSDLIALSAFSK